MISHDQVKAKLIEQGLIDESGQITEAGHEYTRALIARCQQHYIASDGKKDQYLRTGPCGKVTR